MKKTIGLIGYGRIGAYLLERMKRDKELEIDYVHEISAEKTKNIDESLLLKNAKDLTKKVDLVVEAADFRAVREFAPEVLKNNDMLILSASALADQKLSNELEKICEKSGKKIFIPHGALLGMDGLQDARDSLEEVSIVTTKHPKNIDFSFANKYKQQDITEETVLYEGSARGACIMFPRNVNSHAVVAISGIGFDRTRSKLIANPESSEAKHHVIARGSGTVLQIIASSSSIKGVTGDYTLASVYGTIERIVTKKVGINIF